MHKLLLTNTLTRTKEEFSPLAAAQVSIYSCGPTVYDYVTIGNLRTFILNDILKRTLAYIGYDVMHVMNITDVGHLTGDNIGDADQGEDRMEKAAKREQKDPYAIAKHYTEAYLQHTRLLNIKPANIMPRATDHIPEMVKLIDTLIEKGFAYSTKQGTYFHVKAFAEYGKLSGKKLEENKALSREELIEDTEKKDGHDFALWKIAAPNVLMQWETHYGKGFPGWHIECSAMSMKYLGESFDIHTGGEDLMNIHHENEIAQSEAATGKPFTKYWIHGAFLTVDGGRMGKSLGNAYTMDDIVAKGINPLAYRLFTFSAHYRTKLNFTWEALENAVSALQNLYQITADSAANKDGQSVQTELLEKAKTEFTEAITNDLDMPSAMAVVWSALRNSEWNDATKDAFITDVDAVLGLDLHKTQEQACKVTPEISALIAERELARTAKDFTKSDALRKKLNELGIDILDTPQGPRCKVIL